VFLTDGAVGNEARLFELISDELGDSRLFTVGIGSAPNGYFMSRAAEFGRGTYTYIGDISEVQERMADLFAQLRSPALVDVDVQWHGVEVEQYPRYVPDLYLGEPLVVTTQSQHPPSAVTVSGLLGGNHWSRTLSLKQGSEAEGIGVLWARENIKDLMAERSLGGDHELIRTQIIEVALRHHLVSQFTSLVAVDKTPTRPVDESLESESVRTNLPKGWSRSKVFGQLPQTATPAALYLLLGMLSLIGGALLRKARIL
ncbi:MAG: marine proteobacterial sortase target protein, partial [bacterium]